jgi:hypothetical protein
MDGRYLAKYCIEFAENLGIEYAEACFEKNHSFYTLPNIAHLNIVQKYSGFFYPKDNNSWTRY